MRVHTAYPLPIQGTATGMGTGTGAGRRIRIAAAAFARQLVRNSALGQRLNSQPASQLQSYTLDVYRQQVQVGSQQVVFFSSDPHPCQSTSQPSPSPLSETEWVAAYLSRHSTVLPFYFTASCPLTRIPRYHFDGTYRQPVRTHTYVYTECVYHWFSTFDTLQLRSGQP